MISTAAALRFSQMPVTKIVAGIRFSTSAESIRVSVWPPQASSVSATRPALPPASALRRSVGSTSGAAWAADTAQTDSAMAQSSFCKRMPVLFPESALS